MFSVVGAIYNAFRLFRSARLRRVYVVAELVGVEVLPLDDDFSLATRGMVLAGTLRSTFVSSNEIFLCRSTNLCER